MNLEFKNCPTPEQFDTKILPSEKPAFLDYRPDFALIEAVAKEYGNYEHILVIGHGGSITSFYALYQALRFQPGVLNTQAHFLSSIDPDYIAELKQTLKSSNTLVVAITKSGQDTTQLEALFQFLAYPTVVITGEKSDVRAIADKMQFKVVPHPPIGGRFTAFTEVGLLPALMCGMDVDSILRGGRELHRQYEQDNLAWRAASIVWQLEQQGYVDVLGLVYSHYLFASSRLIVQLCHESFGKEGKGQTYTFAEGSEVQHHTAQRLLGGRKNMIGWFIGLHEFREQLITRFPTSIHSLSFRDKPLFDLNGIPLQESQRAELTATLESTQLLNIPALHLELTGLESAEVGRFIAFWQLFAVYSSLLRKVNPFDQPEVENGKRISFAKRLAYKGLL